MTDPRLLLERRERVDGLIDTERRLLRICIDRYVLDLRTACEQDQGTPDGEPGTVGHDMQRQLAALRERIGV